MMMVDKTPDGIHEPRLLKIIWADMKAFFAQIFQGDVNRTLRRDLSELKELFLDDRRKTRLTGMNKFRQGLYLVFWLLKALLLKLTSTRRVLVVLSLVLILSRNGEGNDDNKVIFGSLLLLFVLLLELKDKLLAQNELMAGRAVQLALLPDRKPPVPGWQLWLFSRPANDVGGDLVDFLQIGRNRFGLALGDVAGKGLGAALLMAKLQSTLRALLPDFTGLGELGKKLNRIMHRDGLPNSFASLVYVALQSDSGRLAVLNAGHMPPIAIKNGDLVEMPKGDPALGLMPEVTYTERHIDLLDTEVLFVYSDGLTEARNEQGDFFGEERLMRLLITLSDLSAEEFGERIRAEVEHFSGDVRPGDDLSMIVLKRLGR
jgi:serine phosphatase RsbU (regulator of sigma subunit)